MSMHILLCYIYMYMYIFPNSGGILPYVLHLCFGALYISTQICFILTQHFVLFIFHANSGFILMR